MKKEITREEAKQWILDHWSTLKKEDRVKVLDRYFSRYMAPKEASIVEIARELFKK